MFLSKIDFMMTVYFCITRRVVKLKYIYVKRKKL